MLHAFRMNVANAFNIVKAYNSRFHNLQNRLLKTMPKEPKHTAVLQKQRQKLKEKNQKYITASVTLKVVGSGARGAPKSLYVFTDQSRYLFNCGEGTQRMAHEHKMKLSKLEHIFITYRSWENIGGLPGVALTIQDVGVPEITLHGPERTEEIFSFTRRFVVLRDLSIKMAKCSENDIYEDNVMKVQYVPVIPNINKDIPDNVIQNSIESLYEDVDDDVDYYAHERKRKLKFSDENEKKKICNEYVRKSNTDGIRSAITYICRIQSRPGTLCLDRCVAKGVPPGPLLGKLKAGENIVLNNGTVVKSVDVRLPDDPGPVFIVTECPTTEYIESLVTNPVFSKHQSTAVCNDDIASLVVHFTPENVMLDPLYQSWMAKFPSSTFHLILNEKNDCMGSVAIHRVQHMLNTLHPQLFPMLGDKSISCVGKNLTSNDKSGFVLKDAEVNGCSTENNSPHPVNFARGKTFDNVHLRPKKMFDRTNELTLCPEQFIDEVHAVEGFSAALKELKEKLENIEIVSQSFDRDPQVTFLGTGSCIPNKTRNTSGILLYTSDTSNILMDCGEGTYGQMVRLYGPEKVEKILSEMQAIYISHLHADHHIGLVGLLQARRQAIDKLQNKAHQPVFLLAPRQIMSWLRLYHWNFEPILQEIMLIPNAELNMKEHQLNKETECHLLDVLGMEEINTVPVNHCPNSFGVAFKHKNNWKITYSGDTMPSPQLVELGRGSDLLIHEATMEDELEDEARIKYHSTTSQAIDIGRQMGAQFILLTHFSQRYAKLPRFNENFSNNVGIAFDNMQVQLHELPLLPLLYPSLKLMFAEHYDEMEQKTVRRRLKQEKIKDLLS